MISEATKAIIKVAVEHDDGIPMFVKDAIFRLVERASAEDVLVDKNRACSILGICGMTLYRYVRDGKLHVFKRGEYRNSKKFFRLDELKEFAYSNTSKRKHRGGNNETI